MDRRWWNGGVGRGGGRGGGGGFNRAETGKEVWSIVAAETEGECGGKKRQRKDFTHKVEIVTTNDKGRKNQSPVVNTFAVPERQREGGVTAPERQSSLP